MGKREKGEKGKDGFEELVNKVIGCCIRVHKELGPGFLESVYHRALEVELAENDIPFESEKEVAISFRGHFVGDHRLDFLVDGELVVELKTVEKLGRDHYAQVRSYLKAAGRKKPGLLVNFAAFTLDVRRVETK
ncbi:MAG: GxxExxY protein [Planctomycetota bacterium]